MTHPDILATARAYAEYAAVYDALNAHDGYRRWIEGLEALARRHGLRGRRALDLGCGTGESLLPLVAAGYAAVGVDAVPSMLELARVKTAGRARLVEGDIAALPRLGAFDYVTCLNDPLNYLTTPARVSSALRGMAANAAVGAIVLFDTNNPATFRTAFDGVRREAATPGGVVTWRGDGCASTDGGLVGQATIEITGGRDAGVVRLDHTQVFHADEVIHAALAGAGLRLVARYGQHDDGTRDSHVDPDVHAKTIWLVTPLNRRTEEGGDS